MHRNLKIVGFFLRIVMSFRREKSKEMKGSERMRKDPEGSKDIQRVPKGSKGLQKVPNGSKRLQKIPKGFKRSVVRYIYYVCPVWLLCYLHVGTRYANRDFLSVVALVYHLENWGYSTVVCVRESTEPILCSK